MNFTIPNIGIELEEFNWCHNPEGAGGGQFCSTRGQRGPLSGMPYPKESVKIPPYLKHDVARAQRAGIVVTHTQQPEPVKTSTGELHDPLATSHAQSGSSTWWDQFGSMQHAPTGRIKITTRGGEYEPTYPAMQGDWIVTRRKELTPATPFEHATEEDVISTFRHEVGHLMDKHFYARSKTTPVNLEREIRAWYHAVEMSPEHAVSQRMVLQGLTSHAYHEYRKQALLNDPVESSWWKRVPSWDLQERLENRVRGETEIDPVTLKKAEAFASRILGALQRYGKVLDKRKPGMIRVPSREAVKFYGLERRLKPGPGRGSGRFL